MTTEKKLTPQDPAYWDSFHEKYDLLPGSQIGEPTLALIKLATNGSTIKNVLDIGCGTGALMRLMCTRFRDWKISGMDFSPEAANLVGQTTHGDSLPFFSANMNAIPVKDNSIDLVTAFRVSPFMEPQVPGEIWRILRPGGTLFVATNSEYSRCPPNSIESINDTRGKFSDLTLVLSGRYREASGLILNLCGFRKRLTELST